MPLSRFRKRFAEESGISRLMEDLGDSLGRERPGLMLGGGNPAHIPEVERVFRQKMLDLVQDPDRFARLVGDYDPPKGNSEFIAALADLFRKTYGWRTGPENIALSAGSQSAFFLLFNMFAGEFEDGPGRKILLPLTPEYIGYSDVCLSENCFSVNRPLIDKLSDHSFKYHIDFENLKITPEIGAVCISRPTNPTGNVLSDAELDNLSRLAKQGNVPLIIDNAYGFPFPNIVFTESRIRWEEHIILCMSLSKLGLPGIRTGIIVAREDVIASITKMNAIFSLALGSLGPAMALDLVKTRDILRLSNDVIRPYYAHKARLAENLFKRELAGAGIEYFIHAAEGAIFLWLWFPGLPVSCEELYLRLKKRGVLVVPGHYFFPGLEEDWPHRHECIRVSYAIEDSLLEQGIRKIAGEVKRLYGSDK